MYSVNPKNDALDDVPASFVPMAAIEPDYANAIHPESRPWGSIKKGFTHFADGDIVFSKISPCFENGKYFLAQGLMNGIGAGTTELFVLRPFGSIHLDRRFVFSYLGSRTFVSGATRTFMGTVGQQRVKRGYVEESFVPIPPLEEQFRIANAVSAYVASFQID